MKDKRLNEWCYEWLERYKKRILKPSTYQSYLQAAQRIYCRKKLRKLKIDDIQKNINTLIDKHLSRSSIKGTLTIIEQAVRRAHQLGYCDNIDFSLLELPKSNNRKVYALDIADQRRMLSHLDYSFYGDAFAFLLFSGLRVGEMIALKWSDVDFRKRIIHIRRADYRGQIQEPKTDMSIRDIPLGRELTAILRRNFIVGSEWCFLNSVGGRINYRSMLQAWHRFCNLLSLPDCGLHVLRHTYATNAIAAGINVKIVSEILGHKSVSITLNIYTDVYSSDKARAADQLSDFIFSPAEGRQSLGF